MKINLPIVVRLSLWNTSILLIALIIFGSLSYYFVSKELYYEQMSLLKESGEQVSEIMHIRDGRLDTRHLRYESREDLNFSEKGIFFQIVDKRGKTVFLSPNFPHSLRIDRNISSNQIVRVSDRNGAFSIVSVPATIRTRHRSHKKTYKYFIYTGQSIRYVTRILKRIKHLFFWLIPAVLLIASIGGWYMARKSLSPVVKITKAAREISLRNLQQRLPKPKVEDELGQLTTTFNDMIQRLEKGVNDLRQFTADASHELRTPLTIMRGEIEVTLRRTRSIVEYKEKLADIHKEILWMAKIVENLLTLSRADSDKNFLELKSTKPDKLIREIIESFKTAAIKNSITIEEKFDKSLSNILIDRDKIRQVVNNLLDNAIKYTGKGGNIKISMLKKNNDILIDVTDTGIGIKDEDLPFVFNRFFRADKSRTRFGNSTGLGLSICKLIVEAHNGEITIQSEFGKGTTVQVFLPDRPGKLA